LASSLVTYFEYCCSFSSLFLRIIYNPAGDILLSPLIKLLISSSVKYLLYLSAVSILSFIAFAFSKNASKSAVESAFNAAFTVS